MQSTTKILIAFLLNLGFSLFELIGGTLTGSVAIASDALHDFGDALSTGIAYFLERKSAKEPNEKYTFGYARYSILGALITTAILMSGSLIIIHQSIERLFEPTEVNYDGMMILAIVGFVVSIAAAFVTTDRGHTHAAGHHHHHEVNVNQRAVSLHMFEDAFGWLIVLIGSILMHFTDISIIDPLMSIGVAIFIFVSSIGNLGQILNLFLEKAPANLDGKGLIKELKALPDIIDIHHLHLWSLDGKKNFATLHAKVARLEAAEPAKAAIKQALKSHGISHATVEIEDKTSHCHDERCH